ncbi:MAG TPA: ABC transporter ATP-binding protein [Syntrophorhabdales bacterium]|nr:ABC transporter ATP-binding protein [Syntrophorhabdales bacterium]
MGQSTITVDSISKQYSIGPTRAYHTLRDQLANGFKRLFSHPPVCDDAENSIWALRDVSFEVKEGEVMGIIGRNGSGKSTLLKILSRITEPTEGGAEIRGRVASLLEVGTGFHPELTGRENIYLSAAILGMRKSEITRKFDEILAFSEVERLIDTPVKHYSSGMYVRLAFAVAAHLDPEILLIDEVLAVGDARFQKKCLGKMEEVGKEGRTILFVSHNMAMVASLCSNCILLHEGHVLASGPASSVIQKYSSEGAEIVGEIDYTKSSRKPGDTTALLLKARLTNEKGEVITETLIDRPIVVEMEYQVAVDGARLTPNFHIFGPGGTCAFVTSDAVIDPPGLLKTERGVYRARCTIPGNFLNDGIYYVGFAVSTMETLKIHFYEKDLLNVNIIDPIEGTVTRGNYFGPMPGVVRPVLSWESERLS